MWAPVCLQDLCVHTSYGRQPVGGFLVLWGRRNELCVVMPTTGLGSPGKSQQTLMTSSVLSPRASAL